MKLINIGAQIQFKTDDLQTVQVNFEPCEPPEGFKGRWMDVTVILNDKQIDRREVSGNPSIAHASHIASWAIKDNRKKQNHETV